MDKKLDRFAELLDDLIQEAQGATWKEKATWLVTELESRTNNLNELRDWLNEAIVD